MAKNLFNLLSQEKDKHKILSRGMDVIYYFFIAFFLIYVLIKIYHFIYPTNKTSVELGDQIKVYDKNNKLYKVFEVNVIAKDKNGNGINSCWISWLNTKRPSEYLSIVNCR